MPSLTLKGNNTLSSSSPIDLTSAQATSILDTFSSSLKGLVPSSGGGTANFLRADGTWVKPTGVIDKSTIIQNVTAAVLTNLINYTVPGGTLSTNGILFIKSGGLWANPGGGTKTATLRIAYGGTTLWQSPSGNSVPALTVPWNINLVLNSDNSANAQRVSGLIMIGSQTATVGFGSLLTDEILAATPISGTSAINSSVDQSLVFSVTLSTGGSTWAKYFHTIELF
jgi:hypothetical protein